MISMQRRYCDVLVGLVITVAVNGCSKESTIASSVRPSGISKLSNVSLPEDSQIEKFRIGMPEAEVLSWLGSAVEQQGNEEDKTFIWRDGLQILTVRFSHGTLLSAALTATSADVAKPTRESTDRIDLGITFAQACKLLGKYRCWEIAEPDTSVITWGDGENHVRLISSNGVIVSMIVRGSE